MNDPVWRKSSRSNTSGGECVEVARLSGPGAIGLRDSKNASAGHLVLSPIAFGALVDRIKKGELEL
jgi:uncharacterized protein DUF397